MEIQILHVFSTNRVKLATRKLKGIDNLGQREYVDTCGPSNCQQRLECFMIDMQKS